MCCHIRADHAWFGMKTLGVILPRGPQLSPYSLRKPEPESGPNRIPEIRKAGSTPA